MKKPLLLLLVLVIPICTALSQTLKVAAAANLQSVIKVLQKDFEKKTGITIEPIIGSSGKLVTQIKNGAPFDVFLSADMSFAQSLYADGFCTAPPVVYALGSLVICSNQNVDVKHWQTTLLKAEIEKIAIANPAIAPYGKAAQQALTKAGLFDKLQAKLVFGESIAQVNTYITTGVVWAGFTTQSLVIDAGSTKLYWAPIDKKLYDPIEQGMVILKHAEEQNAAPAAKFYKYLLSSSAKAILRQYGYQTK